jgi:hypothetical protein
VGGARSGRGRRAVRARDRARPVEALPFELPGWLEQVGFRTIELRPIVDVVSPREFTWQWPATFFDSGLARLVELGYFAGEQAASIQDAFRSAAAAPGVRMVTPGVMEIIAVRE